MTNIARLTSTDGWPVGAIPEKWIESLFEKMLFSFGAKFSDQWKGIDPSGLKRHWAEKLGGLTRDELKAGVEKLETLEWPPSLPQFVKLCKPQIDPTVAYYEAVNGVLERERGQIGEWSHPAIFWAAIGLSFDLKQQTYSQIKARWEAALAEQMNREFWEEIPEPRTALPAPGKEELSREKATQVLGQIRASEVLKPKTDHKAWAKKIMDRVERGDKTVSLIQKSFAEEALKNVEA